MTAVCRAAGSQHPAAAALSSLVENARHDVEALVARPQPNQLKVRDLGPHLLHGYFNGFSTATKSMRSLRVTLEAPPAPQCMPDLRRVVISSACLAPRVR